MSNKALLFQLQKKYLRTRGDNELNELAEEILILSEYVLRTYLRNKGIMLRSDARESAIQYAASYSIQRYLEDKDFRIHTSFYSYIRLQILQAVHGPHAKRWSILSETCVDELRSGEEAADFMETVDDGFTEFMWERIENEIDDFVFHTLRDIPEDLREEWEDTLRETVRGILDIDARKRTYLARVQKPLIRDHVVELMGYIREELLSLRDERECNA